MLHDGRLAGLWRTRVKGRKIEITVEPLGRPSRAELDDEAQRAAELRGAARGEARCLAPACGAEDRPRPWLRPPRVRTRPTASSEERHASWLELFFDLVFVVAIAELARRLVLDHSLGGFGIFAGLFLPVFIAWQGFTFYADRFDTDDVLFRAVMLAAMLAIAALAVQIPDVATGRHDAGFVVAYVILRSLLIGLYLRAWRPLPRRDR